MKNNLFLKLAMSFIVLMIVLRSALLAQEQNTIRGVVFAAETELPVPGVTIAIGDVAVGETDKDGKFNVQTAAVDDEVCFSALGLSRACFDVADLQDKDNRIVLEPVAQQMDEVVVESGYEQVL